MRANNNGWDFIKVGQQYQYKEDSFIALVTVVEDNSDEEYYKFKVRVEKSTFTPPQNGEFKVTASKISEGYYSGMIQFYETEEYFCNYKWIRNETPSDLLTPLS